VILFVIAYVYSILFDYSAIIIRIENPGQISKHGKLGHILA
jgi:hypothetical protein